MDEPNIVLCALVRDLALPIGGSERSRCTGCRAYVWVGPFYRAKMRAGRVRPLCTPCGLELVGGEVHIVLEPEVIQEAQKEMIRRTKAPEN